jgi:cystathionine gamma-synthase
VYSRAATPTTTRLEALLSALLGGRALAYASGLAAFHALLVRLRPRTIAISRGYHGCHGIIRIMARLYGLKTVPLEGEGWESAWDAAGLGKGDLVHVETPRNPTGECVDLATLAARAHARGALVSVDATFAPPPLMEPWGMGADVVMHSATKFLGGHSDLLCSVLATRDEGAWRELWVERTLLGGVVGGLEAWLGVRSLRTLEVRVRAQSAGAERVVDWIHACLEGGGPAAGESGGEEGGLLGAESVRRAVAAVHHASVQARQPGYEWVRAQMPRGYSPVFALTMRDADMAKRLPSKLQLFHHATSLGGVESLVEWRRMTDEGVDQRIVRVSVGIEGWEDLRRDLAEGFRAVAAESEKLTKAEETVLGRPSA